MKESKKIVLEAARKEISTMYSKNKKKIIFSIIGFFLLLFLYTNLKYDKGYNIIIENKTEQFIEKISLLPNPRNENVEKMDITAIAPGEKVKIKRTFYQPGESLIAQIDTSKEQNKEIPLTYIYSPKVVNIVFIIVEGVENGKITDLTVKSFENFPSVFWWLKVLYDYNIVEYRGI